MGEDDRLTKNTSVPNWMVQLAVWALGTLGLGAVATLVSVVNWGFYIQSKLADTQSDVEAMEVKVADFNSMLVSTNKTVNEMDRKLDRIEARMP